MTSGDEGSLGQMITVGLFVALLLVKHTVQVELLKLQQFGGTAVTLCVGLSEKQACRTSIGISQR